VDSAAAVVAAGPRDLKVAYTPLHGVGGKVLAATFAAAGFAAPAVVAEQAEPDPAFPTVAFPNPEEPGAMDLLLALAGRTGADLAIANDPDADRCAIAIPGTEPGSWRPLSGDELGVLLADHLIRRGTAGTFATTIVSSTLLRALCAARDVPYAETLTGFKWIVRGAEELAYGYEEALGYCVAPELVRDKDGITAAVTVADLAARLKAEGRSPADRLDELDAEFGVHRTGQVSMRVEDLGLITTTMARIRQSPPTSLLGDPVTEVEDRLPDADVLTLRTARARVVIRPSGTEPKLKAYLEVVEPVTDGDLAGARTRAVTAMESGLRVEISAALGLACPGDRGRRRPRSARQTFGVPSAAEIARLSVATTRATLGRTIESSRFIVPEKPAPLAICSRRSWARAASSGGSRSAGSIRVATSNVARAAVRSSGGASVISASASRLRISAS
jgi:phosphomannomutase